jgi:hypothetical protein
MLFGNIFCGLIRHEGAGRQLSVVPSDRPTPIMANCSGSTLLRERIVKRRHHEAFGQIARAPRWQRASEALPPVIPTAENYLGGSGALETCICRNDSSNHWDSI